MHDATDTVSVSAPYSDLHPVGSDDTVVLREFFLRLRKIPLSSWIGAALPLADVHPEDQFESPLTSAARARLRTICDGMPASCNMARARVHDYVTVAEGFAPPAVVSRMKRVALTAALALVARPHLTAAEFARLYGPFTSLIPADELPRSRG